MAEIDVQPKKKGSGSFLPWLLGILAVIVLCIFLFRKKDTNDTADRDRANYNNTSTNAAAAGGWSAIDWNAPSTNYEEVTNHDIEVRSKDNYAVYGLGENVLFDKDAATLKSGAENNLQQIVASINKRYSGGDVGVFGFTDATGSEGHNQELSQQRAETVRSWLVKHGLDESHVTILAKGENNPVATNSTEEGKQQNRRVEIVARKQ
jgi:outer membrane protein OmpA-like peptidoglycan-associated protein